MPEQYHHLANKCEDTVNLQGAEAYCVTMHTACYWLIFSLIGKTVTDYVRCLMLCIQWSSTVSNTAVFRSCHVQVSAAATQRRAVSLATSRTIPSHRVHRLLSQVLLRYIAVRARDWVSSVCKEVAQWLLIDGNNVMMVIMMVKWW